MVQHLSLYLGMVNRVIANFERNYSRENNSFGLTTFENLMGRDLNENYPITCVTRVFNVI